jgi:DNA replication protein DnaC
VTDASSPTSRRCEFGLCDGSGFLVDEATHTARDCRCRPLRIAAIRARALEARIPKRYRAISFEHSDVIDIERRCPTQVREVRAFAASIDANLDAGHGLWLTGGCGTGKTALAMIVSKAAIDAGRTVAIYSCPRLLSVIRDSIERGGVLDFLDRVAVADLLHIDDLGAEHRTEWVLEQLYTIVNARYEDERSTIVTSNLGRDELAEQLGERIVSRLEGCCEVLPFYGPDHRQQWAAVPPRPPDGGLRGLLAG